MKHSPEEPVMLVCAAVKSMDDLVVPGSVFTRCSVCKSLLWIAPSGQTVLAENPHAIVYCIADAEVAVKEEKEKGEEVKVFMRKESIWEVVEAIKKTLSR